MKALNTKNKIVIALAVGMAMWILVTLIITLSLAGRYPEWNLSYQDLLEKAKFQNYDIMEDGGLISTSIDPMIIIPLPSDHNDVKALYIEVSETSGANSYWAELFLYDDTEWVVRDFWMNTDGTTYMLRNARTDDYQYLRLDLCSVEGVFMDIDKVTINPVSVFLSYGITVGFLMGACACAVTCVLHRKPKKRSLLADNQPEHVFKNASPNDTSRSQPLILRGSLNAMDYILCVVLAFAFTASPHYIQSGICHFNFSFYLSALVLFLLLIFLAAMIRTRLALSKECSLQGSSVLSTLLNQKRGILKVGLIIFACWLPQLTMLYPGTFFNDTFGELSGYMNYLSNQWISDHHPFFDTLLMGFLIMPAAMATGKWHVVMFSYTIFQSLAMSLTFAYTVSYSYKKLGLGRNAAYVLMLIYCFLPLFPLSAQTIGKDSLSVWIFVLYAVQFMEAVRTNGQVLKNRKVLVGFIILGVVLGLTKKINYYIVFTSLVLLLIFEKKARKEMVISTACTAFVVFALLPVAKTTLNVYPGGKQEMFSLPFQMTARYVKDYPEDITAEEATVIDRVLDISDLAERYDPLVADAVKKYEQFGNTSDYFRYISVWFSQGLRHPDAYFHAVNSMLSGWFSWEKYLPLTNMGQTNQLDSNIIPEWVPYRKLSMASAEVLEKLYDNLYSIPLLSILFTYGFYASILPAFLVATVCERQKNTDVQYWLAIIPTILSLVLGCWLAPVSIHFEGRRYLYPVIYTIPLLLMWCLYFYSKKKQSNQIAER